MTGATRPDIPAVPTVAAEPSGAESSNQPPVGRSATATGPARGAWRELRASVALPPGALAAAQAIRYGKPVDTYTWDYVAEAALLAAASLIRADERERIRQLAIRNNAVCAGDEGTYCFFADLIQEPS